jgi:hypothetical protein
MRRLAIALVLPLLLATVAGCLSDGPSSKSSGSVSTPATGSGNDPWPAIQAMMKGVPCDAAVGSGQSPNLVQLANVSYDAAVGIHGELDIRGHIALHARYDAGGFEIIDIADPLHPKDLGAYDYNGEDAGDSLDVKFSPDNATAIFGTGAGLRMVDIRDPTNPVAVGQWNFTEVTIPTDPAPRVSQNAHMLYTANIAGQDWVFLAPNSNTGVWMLKLTGTPDARHLEFVTQTLPVEGGPLGPHDIFVNKDPLDGHWYLYSADGFQGWAVFNVDDPSNPSYAGGIPNPAEGEYLHSIQSALVNGKRYVATIGEIGANILKVYDATILQAPVLLAVYQASPGPGSGAPEHNFNIVAGKLYLSYYTLGMYVFDLSKLSGLPVVSTAQLQPIAHWGDNPEGATSPAGFTGIWDTVLKDGLLYLSNIEGGLYIVGYGCNAVPDPSLTSTG